MEENVTMMQFSQMVFKAAFEKIMPEIVAMKQNGASEEEFQDTLIPKVEALAESIFNSMSEDEINNLMPEVFQASALPFLVEKPIFESFIKQNKRDEFKARVFAAFTTSAILMAIGKIFEWGTDTGTEDNTDSQDTEPEEPVIS